MAIDEIEAFKIARDAAQERGWPWRPGYWISFEKGEWEVRAESESVFRISATGELIPETVPLDPVIAMSIAREYAAGQSLKWKPAFMLSLEPGHWTVGACQSQFGGQVVSSMDSIDMIPGDRPRFPCTIAANDSYFIIS